MIVPPPSFVTVDGRRLAYDEICPPQPRGTVLLITGLAAKRIGWLRQRAVFGARYRTICLDPRDAGDSDLCDAPYTTADQADDAAAVLRALGVEHAMVVGISMGGFIALELALRHPQLVAKLVLTSTSAGGRAHVKPRPRVLLRFLLRGIGRREVGEASRRWYEIIMAPSFVRGHREELGIVAEIARYRPQSRAAFRRQQRACLKHDVTDRLERITIPTLVVHGALDPLVRVENGRYLAAHIPNARLVVYPDTGHIPIAERAEDFNRDVLAFLAEE